MTQFVKCAFREGDRRTYTYRNDGLPIHVGDQVRVPDKSGDGWQRVFVTEVGIDPPEFECKPVLGFHTDPVAAELNLGPVDDFGEIPIL